MILSYNTWKDVCKQIYPNNLKFDCDGDSKFLQSLADEGHDEWLRLSTEYEVERFNKDGNYSGRTSDVSFYFYVEEVRGYYSIDIHKVDLSKFSIKLTFVPQDVTDVYLNEN